MKKAYDFLMSILNKEDIIVIGNSGGPDSMALTDILINLRKKLNLKIIVAHVNHNVRLESKKEAEFLNDYCKKNNIIFEYMIIDKYGDDNFHNEARNIRYNFFDEIVRKYSAKYLMTAHHGDDLIETILMRMVRGSSLKGYSGFSQIVDKGEYRLVRPLIYYSKKEIEDYDNDNNISFVIDKSNFKDKYTRNRYRSTVLPFLKKEEKNVIDKFLKFSNLLAEYDMFIEKQVDKTFNKVFLNNVLLIDKYKELDKIIQNRILSKIFEKYYSDDLILISDTHLNSINNLIYSRKQNGYINLPNNVLACKKYNELEIRQATTDIYVYEIEINDYVKLPNGHIIEKVGKSDSNDNNICRISNVDVSLPLQVRTRKIGDRIMLKNSKGSRKIKDVFIDCKVPLLDRDKWPIVVDSSGKIIWIPGIKKSKFTKSKNEKCDIILKYR